MGDIPSNDDNASRVSGGRWVNKTRDEVAALKGASVRLTSAGYQVWEDAPDAAAATTRKAAKTTPPPSKPVGDK